MAQYFALLNHTKREVVCPWCLGGAAELRQWCRNPQAGVLPYLLRKSTGTGGGDVDDPVTSEYAGRWAGDAIALVGDYDEAGDYQTAREVYANISAALAAEYNAFIGVENMGLRVGTCGVCDGDDQREPVAAEKSVR